MTRTELTRAEYLERLQSCISALPEAERAEALAYYADFFEDAGDDARVMEELGAPEELAKSILEKMACVPAEAASPAEGAEEKRGGGRCCFSFPADSVRNVRLSFCAAEARIVPAGCWTVETRGILRSDFVCRLDEDGTLTVANRSGFSVDALCSHERRSALHPRILIGIPRAPGLASLSLRVGAGSVRADALAVSCESVELSVGAGSLSFGAASCRRARFQCGMGRLSFSGSVDGEAAVDCGMGAVRLLLDGDVSEYSCDVRVGLGDVRIGKDRKSGVGNECAPVKKRRHFSVHCGMGSVSIHGADGARGGSAGSSETV